MHTFCEIDGAWTWSIRKSKKEKFSFANEVMQLVADMRLADRSSQTKTMPFSSEAPNNSLHGSGMVAENSVECINLDEDGDASEAGGYPETGEQLMEEEEEVDSDDIVLLSLGNEPSVRIRPPVDLHLLNVQVWNGDRLGKPGCLDPIEGDITARSGNGIHRPSLFPLQFTKDNLRSKFAMGMVHGSYGGNLRASHNAEQLSVPVTESYLTVMQDPESELGRNNKQSSYSDMVTALADDEQIPFASTRRVLPHQTLRPTLRQKISRAPASFFRISASVLAGLRRKKQSAPCSVEGQRGVAWGLVRGAAKVYTALEGIFVKTKLRNELEKETIAQQDSQPLFDLLDLHPHRVHLSIPLDYLAVQAKLKLQAKIAGNKRRIKYGNMLDAKNSGQSFDTDADAIVPTQPPSKQPGQPVAESIEFKGSNMGDSAGKAVSKIIDLANSSVSTRGVARSSRGLPAASTPSELERPEELWHRLRLRQNELPIDRLMGTAIVQAYFEVHSVLGKDVLRKQMELADGMPWQLPNSRRFS
eukprot:gene8418-10004_t